MRVREEEEERESGAEREVVQSGETAQPGLSRAKKLL